MFKIKLRLSKALCAGMLLFSQISFTQTKTTVTDGAWDDPLIWSPAGVPTAISVLDSIIIDHDITYTGEVIIPGDLILFRINEGKSLAASLPSDSIIFNVIKVVNNGEFNPAYALMSDTLINTGNISGGFIAFGGHFENYGEFMADSIITPSCVNHQLVHANALFVVDHYLENYHIISSGGDFFSGSYGKNYGFMNVADEATFIGSFYNETDAYVEVGDTLDNAELFDNNGQVVCENFINVGHLTGLNGRFCIAEMYLNVGELDGEIDVCDATVGGASDLDYGTTAATVTFCEAPPCSEPVLGIETTTLIDNIKAYPNPATTDITIVIENQTEELRLVLYDMNGRVLQTAQIINGTLQMDLSAYENGTYLYIIEGDNSVNHGQFLLLK